MIVLDDMEYASDAAAQAVWQRILQTLSYTLTSNASANAGTNQRLLLKNTDITSSGNKIQIKLRGVSTATNVTIGGCSIGERSGSTGNFASAPTRITFNGGNSTGTLPGSLGTLTSDVITFAIDETKDYLLHIYYSGSTSTRYVGGGLTRYYRDYDTDNTLTEDISGLSYDTNSYVVGLDSFYIINSIAVQSESTIKEEGSYSLKLVAPQTTSLNKTVTRTLSPTFNLTGQTDFKFNVRSNRTGSNFKIGLHDSGGTTTEVTPNIASADTWQEVTLDLSAVSDANKDAIDSIIYTQLNADAETTVYMDYMRTLSEDEGTGTGGSPRFGGRSGGK
jgi:hypothetical protein